jgi:hypothetical protein
MKIFLLIGIIFCLHYHFLSNAYAEGFHFRKYAGEFMDIGVDARAQAMGGALSSLEAGVTSIYYNPAGMINVQKTQISFMHTQQMISSVNYDFLAVAHRQGKNRILGFSLIRLGIDDIKDSRHAQRIISQNGDWNIDWSQIKEFNASDYIFMFSIAQQWRKNWALGVNLKLIRRNLAKNSANGFGFDLGLQRRITQGLILGTNLRNITTTLLVWNTGEKELVKPTLYLGASYLLNIQKINSNFQPVLDLILRGENRRKSASANLGSISLDYAAGIEYGYHQVLFIRAGIDEISRLNIGTGLQIPHIRIDYAFTNYDEELGNSHRIGLVITL